MTAGMVTNTFISTGVAFAEANAPADNARSTVEQPTITAHDATVEYGSTWNASVALQVTGAKATDGWGNDITGRLNVVGDVNTKISGKYDVTIYSYIPGQSITVVITVKDAPASNATITANNATVEYGSTWNASVAKQVTGVKATDRYGNDVTNNVTVSGNVDTKKPGNYNVTFTSPESGKSTTVVITVKDAPASNATITAHNATVDYGSTWNASVAKQVAGVKATDRYGNDVTNNVTVSGNVDTKKPGNYNVTFISPESGASKMVVITVKEAPEKPVIKNNVYQEGLTGKTTPNLDVLISDNDGFNGALKVKSDSSGNFTVTSSQLSSLNEYTPGNLLYIKSGNLASGNYGEVSTSVIRYPKPQVAISYAYNQEITGTAYPNSKIFISDSSSFEEYVTSVADKSGHFTVPVSQLMTLSGYESGRVLYVQNSDTVNSQASSAMPLITITEAQASITANDFTLEYGAEFNDQIAIEKAGVIATDAEGNVEGVKVKESNVDTSKPGEYSVTFVSDSGKEKTVKVTVKEQEVTKPNAPVITSNPYYYGDNLIGEIAPGLTVKVYPNGGNLDNALEFETTSGTFAFTAEELKKAFGDQYKANRLLAVVAYDQTTGMTSDATPVMVLPSQAPTLEAESTIHVAYGSDWNDDIAKKQAKVKATDAKGNDVTKDVKVTSNPVDTSKPGNYTVEFSVTANELTTTAKTTVIVDEKQVIGSEPAIHATDTTYQVGETLNPLLGVTAEDAEDGDLTNQVQADASGVNMSKAGDYELKLSVTDKDGNTTEQTVTVHVVDQVTDGPVIKGADDTSIDLNTKFDPLAGVTAQDSQGNDLTERLTYTGTVDTSTTGEYTINYYVYDKDGKVATTERKVTVNEPTVEPTIEAHDFEVDYGFDLTDEAAIEKAEAKATDKYGNEEAVKIKETNVDTSKPGEYSMTFISDSGKEKTVKVTVKNKPIVGSEPVIHASDTTYQVGETLNPLLGVTAEDPEDGDLTDQVKADATGVNMSKPGDYELILSVTDKDGNTTEQKVTVHVVDQVTDGPVIKGAEDIRIDERSKFDPLEGVTAQDGQGNDITDKLTYTGSVDTSTPGEYTINYYVYDKDGKVATAKRVVTVQSDASKPVVMSPDKLTVKQNSKFDPTLYAQAYDNEDGDITDQIKVLGQIYTDKLGSQFITYEVTDSDGNKASKIMEVEVVATLGNAPVISGADDIEINVGDAFDPISGVTAYDNEDGDLTSEIKYGGIVDTGKAGEYTVTYTVWDSDFNTETVDRKVTVKDPTVEPTIEANDFEVDYGFDLTDEAAIEKAGAKATDKYGKEEGVKVKESNVDTSKPGEYSMTFISDSGKEKTVKVTVRDQAPLKPTVDPIKEGAGKVTGQGQAGDKIVITVGGKEVGTGTVKADGTFEILTGTYRAKAGDVYSVQAFNSENAGSEITDVKVIATAGKVNPDEYTIGDANVTGSYTGDVTSIAVFINGVNKGTTSGANVKDGQFTYYVGKNIKMGDVVTVVGYDKYGKRLDEKELTIYNKETIQTPTVDDIYVGDTTVTGTGQAGTTVYVKLGSTILGQAEVKEDGTFEVTIPAQKAGTELTILAKDGEEASELVSKIVIDQLPQTPSVDDIKDGAGKVTGKGQAGDTIVINVNGKEIGRGKVKADGTFELLTGTYRAKQGDTYEVYAVNDDNVQSETVKKVVVATSGQVKPNDYVLGELSVTGTYTGDVTTVAVFVDGVELGKTSGANVANGQFNFYVGDHIKAGQKVTVVGYDKYGKRLDEKEVTIDNGVDAPTVNDIYAGDTTVTGTGEAGSTVYVKDHLKNIIGQAEVKADGTYEVTIPAQVKDTQLIVMAKKGNARSEEVNATVLAARPTQPTVDAVKEGAGKITGTAQAGDTVVITLNGKEVGRGEVSEDGTFSIILSSKVRADNKYEITAVNSDGISSVATEVTATATEGTITPDPFKVGGNSITGTFTGDVSSINLMIDGAPQGVVSGNSVKDGVFSYYVGKLSIQADQTVEVVAYDAYGKQLDQQTVTINA